jgi:hypothetical protein
MNLEDIKLKYVGKAIERSGCWLLDTKSTLDFLDDLEAAGIELSGIEGYWLREEVLEPSLQNSLYFIGNDIRVATLEGDSPLDKARNFVNARIDSGLLFDFDLSED